jgi:hypothetical protein
MRPSQEASPLPTPMQVPTSTHTPTPLLPARTSVPTLATPGAPTPTPCVSVTGTAARASQPRLGAPLAVFVVAYGQPVVCAMNDLRFPVEGVGAAGGYTIDLPDSDPVRFMQVTADAGVVWDALTQQRVCQGYLPPDPTFVGSSGNIYTYQTTEGMVELINGSDGCVLEFTGM